MDTVVCLKVVTAQPENAVQEKMARAFHSFHLVENVCSRFNEQSEGHAPFERNWNPCIVIPVKVSDILFEAIRFAWEVADHAGGEVYLPYPLSA